MVPVSKRCLLKAFSFCKNYFKRVSGAKKCNTNRYLVWVNKRLVWIPRQQYRGSQDLPSALVLMNNVVFNELESFKLPCYLPILGNSYKIIITWITFGGCLESSAILPMINEYQARTVCSAAAWISCFINNLIRIRFIPFWMNIIEKELYKLATVELEHFRILL